MDIHRKSKLFLDIHENPRLFLDIYGKSNNILDFPGKSKLFWISTDNPKYFGYRQTIHNIIGFPPQENNNIAQTFYTYKKIVL